MALERPPNPDYGDGALRRRIRLRSRPGAVEAYLDDNFHAMQCRVFHDDAVVTGIESEMIRAPMSTCPGARRILQDLVGEPLSRSGQELAAGGRARRHCTHLFDLALLALGFTREATNRRQIDVVVPDAVGGARRVRVWVDDGLAIDWTLQGDIIVSPEAWRGQDLGRGFLRRASAIPRAVERDAALMAQKAVIVARGRSHIFDKAEGAPVQDAGEMLGACYSYSVEHYSGARRITEHARDFSAGVVEAPDLIGRAAASSRAGPAAGIEESHG